MLAGFTMATFYFLSPVNAEEIEIGHLETNDDTGINWLYFHCDKSTPEQMRCSIIQTLIMKKKDQADLDAEIKRQAETDPLDAFNKTFSSGCGQLVDNEKAIQQSLKTGIGGDNKPINTRIVRSGWPVLKAIIDVCKKPSRESADHLFKLFLEQDKRSCKVHNGYSESTFIWNGQTSSWISKQGPSGPCGTFILVVCVI